MVSTINLNMTEVYRIAIHDMMKRVRQVNEENGWFDSNRSVAEGHMLIVTETAEAVEAWRKHGFDDLTDQNSDVPKPEGYGSEMSDILIRLLDQCDRDGVDLVKEFERKLSYNKTRGYRHGGRAL